jgi:hypothetical protein
MGSTRSSVCGSPFSPDPFGFPLGMFLQPHRDSMVVESEQLSAKHSEPVSPPHSSAPEPTIGSVGLFWPLDWQTLLLCGHHLDLD